MKSLCGLVLVAGCSSSPANVAGNYTLAITNGANGCNFPSFTVGSQATGIPLVMTQSGDSATATINGLAAVDLDALLGTNVFPGTIDGDNLDLKLQGSSSKMMGNCAYTVNAEIRANLSTDTLTGQVTYTDATNNNSDCAALQGCSTVQDFNGTRPPQ